MPRRLIPIITLILCLTALVVPVRATAGADSVLRVGQVAEPASLDPARLTSSNDFRVAACLYDGLVRYARGTLDIAPGLAASWDISPDGLTYTFHLRRGVIFHDGSPFDAEAVRFNFQRMLEPEHPQHHGPFPLAFFFKHISDIQVADSHTVRFVLSEPFAPFLSNLAYPSAFMVSPQALREHGAAYGSGLGAPASGTGFFRLAAWDGDDRIRLEANTQHWEGPPLLEGVVFVPVADDAARLAALRAGDLDCVLEVPPAAVPAFRQDPAHAVHQEAGPHVWFGIMNLRHGPFTDRRVRLAANLAVDKVALVNKVLRGTAEVASGPVPRAFSWAFHYGLRPRPHDPAEARRLLEAAGAVGSRVVFRAPESGSGMLAPRDMARAVKADLEAVGLAVKLEFLPWNDYLASVNAGLGDDCHLAAMAWMTNDPDTLPYLTLRSDTWPGEGGFNSGYYANPEVDSLLDAARAATDREERGRLYRRVQELVYEDVPWLPVASWRQTAVTAARVAGFTVEPSFLLRLEGVELTR